MENKIWALWFTHNPRSWETEQEDCSKSGLHNESLFQNKQINKQPQNNKTKNKKTQIIT